MHRWKKWYYFLQQVHRSFRLFPCTGPHIPVLFQFSTLSNVDHTVYSIYRYFLNFFLILEYFVNRSFLCSDNFATILKCNMLKLCLDKEFYLSWRLFIMDQSCNKSLLFDVLGRGNSKSLMVDFILKVVSLYAYVL